MMNLKRLKENLTSVLPILDANLKAAHDEYMSCDISAGAFGVVRHRHEMVCMILSHDDSELNPENCYKLCVLVTIDIRCGVRDSNNEADKVKLENWWQCFREAGFTEVNSFYNVPMLPA